MAAHGICGVVNLFINTNNIATITDSTTPNFNIKLLFFTIKFLRIYHLKTPLLSILTLIPFFVKNS